MAPSSQNQERPLAEMQGKDFDFISVSSFSSVGGGSESGAIISDPVKPIDKVKNKKNKKKNKDKLRGQNLTQSASSNDYAPNIRDESNSSGVDTSRLSRSNSIVEAAGGQPIDLD